MADQLDDTLAGIADHGRRTATLAPAAAIRGRSDRRRRRRHGAGGALAVALLAAGAALGGDLSRSSGVTVQPGETHSSAPHPSPTATSRTTAAVPAVDRDVLAGRRRSSIASEPGADSLLAVRGDRVELSGAHDDNAVVFVLVPDGTGVRIEAPLVLVGGKPRCLAVRSKAQTRTLGVDGCRPGDAAQVFHFSAVSTTGATTRYAIENDGAYVQWFRSNNDGLVVEPAGGDDRTSTFVFAAHPAPSPTSAR